MLGCCLAGLGVLAVLAGVADALSADGSGLCTPRWHVVVHSNAVSLSDVLALSPTNVWGSGPGGHGLRPTVVHWDGHAVQTRVLEPKEGSLDSIAAVSPRDIWAVGSTSTPLLRSLAVHWNGVRWTVVATPPVGHEDWLSGIAMIGSDNAWAVGSSRSDRVTRALLLHWNGSRWVTVNLAGIAPPSSNLSAVDAASANDVWAVGPRNVDSVAFGWTDLVLHWDGRQWREVASPLAKEALGPYPGRRGRRAVGRRLDSRLERRRLVRSVDWARTRNHQALQPRRPWASPPAGTSPPPRLGVSGRSAITSTPPSILSSRSGTVSHGGYSPPRSSISRTQRSTDCQHCPRPTSGQRETTCWPATPASAHSAQASFRNTGAGQSA